MALIGPETQNRKAELKFFYLKRAVDPSGSKYQHLFPEAKTMFQISCVMKTSISMPQQRHREGGDVFWPEGVHTMAADSLI